jgi:hypothetical protein
VILPKQATPWYQFVGSGGVDLSSYREKSISLSGTPAREKTLLWTELSGRRCTGLGSKLFLIKFSFFVILFYRKAGNLLIWQIRSKQLNRAEQMGYPNNL